jgi:CheY-like chemotaxis protein
MSRPKILVVDDERMILQLLKTKLESAGYDVLLAHEPSEAVQIARAYNPDLYLLDVHFPPDPNSHWDGFNVADWLHHLGVGPDKVMIFITGDDIEQHMAHAQQAGAAAIFPKPLNIPQLLAAIGDYLAPVTETAA